MPKRSDLPEARDAVERVVSARVREAALEDDLAGARQQTNDELAEAWRKGASMTALSDALGLSRRTLYNRIREARNE